MDSPKPCIIYPALGNPGWEEQFILSDVLRTTTAGTRNVIRYTTLDVNDWKQKPNVNDIIGRNIFVYSSNFWRYPHIRNFVKFIRPIIIFHLSDESGNKEAHQLLALHTPLLIRQYFYNHYKHFSNIHYIPLGYMSGMMESNYMDIPLKLPTERKYAWSFIGCPNKSDRPIMLQKMSEITPHVMGKMSSTDMRDLYRDTVFVPVGRGFSSLDCFRIYEASICGAIPIIVGDAKEIKATFSREVNPPCLFFSTWSEAVYECKYLLKDTQSLNKKSRAVSSWWTNQVNRIRSIVENTIDKHSGDKPEPGVLFPTRRIRLKPRSTFPVQSLTCI